MRDKKFIKLLETLNNKEFRAFKKYFKQLHHRKEDSFKVIEYVEKFKLNYKSLENKKVEDAYQEIFHKELISENERKNFLNVLYKLNGFLQEFLVWQRLQKKGLDYHIHLLKGLKARQLDAEFAQTLKNTFKLLEKNPKDVWYYAQLMEINDLIYFSNNIEKLIAPSKGTEVKAAMEALDKLYVLAKLKYACELLSRADILPELHPIYFLDEVLQLGKDRQMKDDIYLVYKQLLELVRYKELSSFKGLQQTLLQKKYATPHEQLILLTYLANFAAAQIRKGETSYYQDAFQIYQFGVQQGLLLVDGYFPITIFNNIVNLACTIKDYQWANEFIDKYGQFLSKDHKKETISFCQIRIRFAQKKYKTIVVAYKTSNFKMLIYKLQLRNLCMRAMVELDADLVEALNFCEAMEQFLYRNKDLTEKRKESHQNFLKITKGILMEESKTKLTTSLNEMELVVCKDWLMDKIKAL